MIVVQKMMVRRSIFKSKELKIIVSTEKKEVFYEKSSLIAPIDFNHYNPLKYVCYTYAIKYAQLIMLVSKFVLFSVQFASFLGSPDIKTPKFK